VVEFSCRIFLLANNRNRGKEYKEEGCGEQNEQTASDVQQIDIFLHDMLLSVNALYNIAANKIERPEGADWSANSIWWRTESEMEEMRN
jgi:hypothetical protein